MYNFLFLQFRLMRKSLTVSHSVSPSLARAPNPWIPLSILRKRTGRPFSGGAPLMWTGFCFTLHRGRQHCVWRATRWEECHESCGTSGVPIGGESLAVAPYLMDPATVLLERFAKRSTHGVLTPPGFAGYGLGLLDSLRSSQLNPDLQNNRDSF